MRYIKEFENFQNSQSILMIIDVQKSFKKFFSEMYINELMKYCKNFELVVQIFDNHVDGKNVDTDYLYQDNPTIPVHNDLYQFPNQKLIIEKRYNYDVDVDFYKDILDKETYNKIKKTNLKRGMFFPTKMGTIIVYIGNNHQWFQVPKKLYNLLKGLKGKKVTIVGGADSECLEDVITAAESLEVDIKRDWRYIYTSTSCPI